MRIRRPTLRVLSGRYLIALGVAAGVMIGSVVGVNLFIDSKLSSVKRVTVRVAPSPPNGGNYLLLGSDTRAFVKNAKQKQAFGDTSQTQGQRSDTMMIVHVEPGSKKTLVVSFPRDLWVNVPGMGMSKINSAFGIGPDKVIQTLKADFNIDINHYMEVDFQSFQGIVNAIGRVPVYFPYPARDKNTGLNTLGGCVQLDGAQALSYSRSRELEFLSLKTQQWISADPTADIGRINRQQQFIRELAAIAVQRSLDDPLTANTVVDRVLENLTIDQNLSKSDVFSLVDAFRTVNPNDTSHLEFQTLPWETGPDQSGQSVLYVKQPDAQFALARLRDFSGKSNTPPSTTVTPHTVKVQVLDGSGKTDPQSALNQLVSRAGFLAAGAGRTLVPIAETEVRYKPGSAAAGSLVLQYLSPAARLVADPTLQTADVAVVIGKNFQSIVLPSGTASATSGGQAGVPTAGPPSTGDTTAQTSNGSALDPAKFGQPIPKTPPCK